MLRRPTPDSKSAEDEQDQAAPQDESVGTAWLTGLPSWLFSMVSHVVVILALALMTIKMPEEPIPEGLLVSASEKPLETQETIDQIDLEIDEVEIQDDPQPSEVASLAEINIPDPAGLLAETPQFNLPDTVLGINFDSKIEWKEVGSGEGDNGTGIGKSGLGRPVKFFGVATKGRRFMFVVDNSNSMNRGRFETAVDELAKTIGGLSANQEFYIVFYSDTAYPLFYPYTARGWVRATPQNKIRLRSWLAKVQRCLRTNGREAFRLAFAMKPDVIYLLGDGAFGDNPLPDVLAMKDDKLVIHTMGFDMKKGRDQFGLLIATKEFNLPIDF